jgi:short-subunit dehydrogenase
MSIPRTILITGASSGIGAALALTYATKGRHLFLCGRNAERLQAVADACFEHQALVETAVLDVCDSEAMAQWIEGIEARMPLDLVIANAGISGGTAGGDESPAQTRAIFRTNLDGVLNTVLPAIPFMRHRGKGQIALVSSLAGFRGFASAPAYSASKAAVKAYGEGLRGWLKPDGVQVCTIFPGFIRTPMTDVNPFPMPFLMEAEQAAATIKARLERGDARIAFPLPMALGLRLLTLLPYRIADLLVGGLPGKPGVD